LGARPREDRSLPGLEITKRTDQMICPFDCFFMPPCNRIVALHGVNE